MSIYDDVKEIADEVMPEFKQGDIKLVQIVPGTGPADDPGEATEVEHSLDATAKGISYKYAKMGFSVETDLEVVSAIVAGVSPSKRDFVDIDGTRHKIVEDMTVPSAGTKIVWRFIVRKGG